MAARSTSGVISLRGSFLTPSGIGARAPWALYQFGTLAFALAWLMQVAQSMTPPSSTSRRIAVFLLFHAFDRLLSPAERSL